MNRIKSDGSLGDILIVDDDLSSLRVLERLLSEEGYQVRSARDGNTALMIAGNDPPELILLDVVMPDLNGFDVCRRLKASSETKDIPVIFISGLGDVVDTVHGFEAGGVDYITKPYKLEEVQVRIRTHLTLYRLRRELDQRNRELQQEIKEREQAQNALALSEASLKAQYEGIPIPTYTWQKNGDDAVLVAYNSAAEEITQQSIVNFVGSKASDMYPDRPDIHQDICRCLNEQSTFEREVVYQFLTTGEIKHLMVKYAFVAPDLALVHTEDITARKHAEAALEEQRNELKRRVEELMAINRIAHIVANTIDLEDTLAAVCQQITLLFANSLTLISVPERDTSALMVVASHVRGIGASTDTRLNVPLAELPITCRVLDSGRTEVVEDFLSLSLAEPVRALALQFNIQTLLVVPLIARGRAIGTMSLGLDDPQRQIRDDEVALAETLAVDVAGAIENARLAEKARAAAVDAERQRLARELHDSVTQSLYSLTLLSSGWRNMALQGTLGDPADSFRQLEDLGQQALKEMRLLIHQLRPPILEEVGLVQALQQRLDAVELRASVESRLRTGGNVDNIPHALEDQLFYIAQEALNNALRHAFASAVNVRIQHENECINLTVEDDGKGFDPNKPSAGLGLKTMRERAETLDGSLSIISAEGQGTVVEVIVPLAGN